MSTTFRARSHRGAWHEFRQRLVVDGTIDAGLVTDIQRLQTAREQADYDAADILEEDALAAVESAERFVTAVAEVLIAGGS